MAFIFIVSPLRSDDGFTIVECLRQYWKEYPPKAWLFEGQKKRPSAFDQFATSDLLRGQETGRD